MHCKLTIVLLALSSLSVSADELRYGPIPFPRVDSDSWVLIEVWPVVHDITLSAFFLDSMSRKNQNLCEATKRALDRDAEALAKIQGTKATSRRECYTLRDAIKMGYVASRADDEQ